MAVAASARFGMKHYLADTALWVTRAEALHAVGRVEEALETLGRVRDDLLERAARIRDAAYARSFVENVFIHARMSTLWNEWTSRSASA